MSDSLNSMALPSGFRVRAPSMRDLPEAFDLLTACDLAHLGTPDTVLEDLREEWGDLDLEHDAFLVLALDGRPVGVATVAGQTRMQAHVYVHPAYGQRGIEEYLRHVTEARARARAGDAWA